MGLLIGAIGGTVPGGARRRTRPRGSFPGRSSEAGCFVGASRGRQIAMTQDNPGAGRGLRGPLIFGVVAATIELAIVLWLVYC